MDEPGVEVPASRANAARAGCGSVGLIATLVLLALIVALAQAMQAWSTWRASAGPLEGLAPGDLCSVQLVNGQIYYGHLVEASARQVRLSDVYYVQAVVDAPGAAPSNRLVNRRKADWHAPEAMIIPAEKVSMLEKVGAASRLAQLIEQDQKVAAASSPGQ